MDNLPSLMASQTALETEPDLHSLIPVSPKPIAPPFSYTIPVVDLHGLTDPSARPSIVRALALACSEGGLFLVANHGIDVALLEVMLRAAEAFFALPLDEKMKYAEEEAQPSALVHYGSSLNSSDDENLSHMGRPFVRDTCHLWPTRPANYKDAATAFLQAVWKLSTRLAGGISDGLGKELSFKGGLQTMASNYYTACQQPNRPCTDWAAISIVMDNHVDGLQMKREGRWVPVPHVAGTLVVNVGQCLEKLSGGSYRAAEHRVVVNKGADRISVAVGNGPRLELTGPSPPIGLPYES